MADMTISKDIIHIGASDKEIDLFEGQYVLENGMAYNSYLIKDKDYVIFDTVDERVTAKWLQKLTEELAQEQNITVDTKGFEEKFKEHQEKSRAGSKERFKGGLQSDSEMNIKYHTATHLLNAALKKVIGPESHQMGSNITDERMRFDFPCDHKLTEEEKKKVEDLVNQWIKDSIPVTHYEVSKDEARFRFRCRLHFLFSNMRQIPRQRGVMQMQSRLIFS